MKGTSAPIWGYLRRARAGQRVDGPSSAFVPHVCPEFAHVFCFGTVRRAVLGCVLGSLACLQGCPAVQRVQSPIEADDGPPQPWGWGQRRLHAFGENLYLRASTAPVGAGPNYWNDREVAVDAAAGALTLRLFEEGGLWRATEVAFPASSRYQEVEMELAGPLGSLDPNIIVGVFMYRDDASEVDIEFGRWGQPHGPNLLYSVIPGSAAPRRRPFALPASCKRAQLRLRWLPRLLEFLTRCEGQTYLWRDVGAVMPVPNRHRLHINLWLHQGKPPRDGREVKLVVTHLRRRFLSD